MKRFVLTLISAFMLFSLNSSCQYIKNGFPENAACALTNGARFNPSQYASTYDAQVKCSFNPKGVQPIYLVNELSAAAQSHSSNMASLSCFSHDSCGGDIQKFGGKDFGSRIGYFMKGLSGMAENIAAGAMFKDPLSLINGWLKSPGHCENMLAGQYNTIGLATADGSDAFKTYATQDLGTATFTPPNPIFICGGHIPEENKARFFVSTTASANLVSIVVTFNGKATPLEKTVSGSLGNLWEISVDATGIASCMSYFFTAVDAKNNNLDQYPIGSSAIIANGVGSCSSSGTTASKGPSPVFTAPAINIRSEAEVPPAKTYVSAPAHQAPVSPKVYSPPSGVATGGEREYKYSNGDYLIVGAPSGSSAPVDQESSKTVLSSPAPGNDSVSSILSKIQKIFASKGMSSSEIESLMPIVSNILSNDSLMSLLKDKPIESLLSSFLESYSQNSGKTDINQSLISFLLNSVTSGLLSDSTLGSKMSTQSVSSPDEVNSEVVSSKSNDGNKIIYILVPLGILVLLILIGGSIYFLRKNSSKKEVPDPPMSQAVERPELNLTIETKSVRLVRLSSIDDVSPGSAGLLINKHFPWYA